MKNKTERDPGYFLTLAGFDFARDFFVLSQLTAPSLRGWQFASLQLLYEISEKA